MEPDPKLRLDGCQFMEGRLEHLAEVHRRGVRHLQLVHFMRSDLGDNQTTPLILPHTNLASRRLDPFTRLITGDHGKLVASTGGVVGIWASPTFTSLAGYVDGVTRAVETLGVDHVGFGTDNSGFGHSHAVWTDYADLPLVVQLLRRKGVSAADVDRPASG